MSGIGLTPDNDLKTPSRREPKETSLCPTSILPLHSRCASLLSSGYVLYSCSFDSALQSTYVWMSGSCLGTEDRRFGLCRHGFWVALIPSEISCLKAFALLQVLIYLLAAISGSRSLSFSLATPIVQCFFIFMHQWVTFQPRNVSWPTALLECFDLRLEAASVLDMSQSVEIGHCESSHLLKRLVESISTFSPVLCRCLSPDLNAVQSFSIAVSGKSETTKQASVH